ncbi:hypothetical protein Pmar_PMAR005985 [Perkinsus marinus ATCC 50983]|uniref:Saccharopine dehydrogenase NADP binding domain-containing protein n=1 Tax=Perkinsus marinus (strain ATCC 50983 / TXsc) TaxID=423536 RepID=C5L9W7_PERM5|nr:hypothetical protein Pmar_PMAR005985 [Perkinsus marinus ATCC 50983]EER06223.1 hypothetical protein Pmar_PMAR005985 [Perkinsus marinus ATCC 50983]|eukprot:XP_002774407.1 hypothetical protein Pmar_PMAR005985 [Perkinsus marinus ATCC 50983]
MLNIKSTSRPVDIAVFGATGFTGSLYAIPNLDDEESLHNIVARAKVVISAAGPFMAIGTPLVRACIACGTHYCDITGETPWVARDLLPLHEKAKMNKTFIVNFCGFDSQPADLLVGFAEKILKAPLLSAEAFVSMRGTFSGGTLQSGIAMAGVPEASDLYSLVETGRGSVEEMQDLASEQDGEIGNTGFGVSRMDLRPNLTSSTFQSATFACRSAKLDSGLVLADGDHAGDDNEFDADFLAFRRTLLKTIKNFLDTGEVGSTSSMIIELKDRLRDIERDGACHRWNKPIKNPETTQAEIAAMAVRQAKRRVQEVRRRRLIHSTGEGGGSPQALVAITGQ